VRSEIAYVGEKINFDFVMIILINNSHENSHKKIFMRILHENSHRISHEKIMMRILMGIMLHCM